MKNHEAEKRYTHKTRKRKVLVAGYETLSPQEKKEARGVIEVLKKKGYKVDKV